MPFCTQCGAENPNMARFCDQCGAQLETTTPTHQPATTHSQAARSSVDSSGGSVSAGPGKCPQCGAVVIPGEAFCDTCGASLLTNVVPVQQPANNVPSAPIPSIPDQPTYPPPQPSYEPIPSNPAPNPLTPSPPPPPPIPAVPYPQRTLLSPATLIIQGSGVELSLPAAEQAVIGRADKVSNFYPDIDLTPHQGLEKGVGRRHARLSIQGDRIMLEDLDSTNGTYLNSTRVPPRTPQFINHGDEIILGRFKLQLRDEK